MGFLVYFPTGVPVTELDRSSPITSGLIEIYQNHLTTHQWRNHNLRESLNGVLFKMQSARLSINEDSEIWQSYVTLLSRGCATWRCVSKGLISKNSSWCSNLMSVTHLWLEIWGFSKVTCPRNNDATSNWVRLLHGIFSKSWLYLLSKFNDLRLSIAEDKKIG